MIVVIDADLKVYQRCVSLQAAFIKARLLSENNPGKMFYVLKTDRAFYTASKEDKESKEFWG